MAYQGRQPGVGVRNRFIYSATGGQTSFSGADSNGLTLAYADATYVDVFLNGTLLVPVTDYAATTKTSVVLGSGAAASDIVEIVAYDISSIANAVPISGGTMTGNLTVQGTVAATAVTGDGSGLTGLPAGVGGANGVTFNDNVKAQFGAGSDLQIYHDGNDSKIIENGNGDLYIGGASNMRFVNSAVNATYAMFTEGGKVQLNYNDSKRFETTDLGVDVTGTVTSDGLTVTQSGATFTPSSQTVALFQRNSATGSGAKVCILAGNLSSSDLNFGDVDSEDQGRLRYEHNNDAMTFTTNGSERMRINANGSKDFGSFQAFSGGYNTIIGAGSAASYALRLDATGTGSAGVLQVVNGYGQVGSIRVNGASTQFNTSSDYRLKTDVQPMAGASARVQALNPVNFEWIADGNRTDGFLAHEAQEVVPEAITGIKDAMKDEPYEVTPAVLDDDGNVTTEAVMGTRSVPDYQGIDQSKLVPLLTAALQEALTEIASLKTRVEALES